MLKNNIDLFTQKYFDILINKFNKLFNQKEDF